ncbi:MAG: hypothetical protein GC134_07175 [Proteobacteria bacterium]|nr:hypothetical protein [Pseudomonadota bacterium]
MGKILAAVLGLGLLGTLIVGGIMLATSYNSAVRTENAIDARVKQNQNIYSTYGSKLQEMAQVADLAVEDQVRLQKTVVDMLSARYGAEGSKAAFQWIQEQNPSAQVDGTLYRQLTQVVEAGRNEFKNAQTGLIDACNQYRNQRETFPGNLVLGMLGFPRDAIALEKKCTPILTAETLRAYETGVDRPIQMRPRGQ